MDQHGHKERKKFVQPIGELWQQIETNGRGSLWRPGLTQNCSAQDDDDDILNKRLHKN